ncbi:MAG: AAA family ATPase [Lachnospiraceae bacterium]|nr:AAA family ATPase [Lachnospiraceae bacterium]
MKDYITYIENHISEKKHLIITGSRGSGKSTLLKKYIEYYGDAIPGIITWCEPGKAVYMRASDDDSFTTIGLYSSDGASKENRMIPIQEGFTEYGVNALTRLINSKTEWMFIDEIGYLEGTSKDYLAKLNEAFQRKKVMAVVRKQKLEFLRDIINQKDALVIDLDIGI